MLDRFHVGVKSADTLGGPPFHLVGRRAWVLMPAANRTTSDKAFEFSARLARIDSTAVLPARSSQFQSRGKEYPFVRWFLASAARAEQRVVEAAEEIMAVVRAGRGLGVVLHAESRHFAMIEAFDGAVVEAAVGDFQEFGQ
jgi:hypothetical protein